MMPLPVGEPVQRPWQLIEEVEAREQRWVIRAMHGFREEICSAPTTGPGCVRARENLLLIVQTVNEAARKAALAARGQKSFLSKCPPKPNPEETSPKAE